jgi:hypothetical protein
MLCDDCKRICITNCDFAEQSGDVVCFVQPPFKSSFFQLYLSAENGCKCCAFLVYSLETNSNLELVPREAIDCQLVYLSWFEMCIAEDGGGYLSLKPHNEDGEAYEDSEGNKIKIDASLEIFTMRGKLIMY